MMSYFTPDMNTPLAAPLLPINTITETKSDGTAKYEVDRSDNRYLKLYNILNRRKKKKKTI